MSSLDSGSNQTNGRLGRRGKSDAEVRMPRHVQLGPVPRCVGGMKAVNESEQDGRSEDNSTAAATKRMELYCATHPGSPSAARRPELLYREHLWIAQLSPTVKGGIVGIGPTVEAALRAFDAQVISGPRT